MTVYTDPVPPNPNVPVTTVPVTVVPSDVDPTTPSVTKYYDQTLGLIEITDAYASEEAAGVAEIATTDETTAGVDDLRFITPLKLQQKLAAAAWRRPKAQRRALLSGLLRLRTHVILCMRAAERTRLPREARAGQGDRRV